VETGHHLYVITRLEAIRVVLLELQAVSFGSFQTFRSALNVHKHLCDKFKSPISVNNNILSKCLSYYGNWQFIAVFTKADRWTLFRTTWNTYHPVSTSFVSVSLNQSLCLCQMTSLQPFDLQFCMHCSCPSISYFNIHSDSICWSVYVMKVLIIENMDSSVGLVTTLLAGRRGNWGSISSTGNKFFCFSKRPGRLWVLNQCRNQRVPELFPGDKVAGAWG